MFHDSIYKRFALELSEQQKRFCLSQIGVSISCVLRKFFDVVVGFLRLSQTRSEPRPPIPCTSGTDVLAGVLNSLTGQNFTSSRIPELFVQLLEN